MNRTDFMKPLAFGIVASITFDLSFKIMLLAITGTVILFIIANKISFIRKSKR